jgi:hypothetical protein
MGHVILSCTSVISLMMIMCRHSPNKNVNDWCCWQALLGRSLCYMHVLVCRCTPDVLSSLAPVATSCWHHTQRHSHGV